MALRDDFFFVKYHVKKLRNTYEEFTQTFHEMFTLFRNVMVLTFEFSFLTKLRKYSNSNNHFTPLLYNLGKMGQMKFYFKFFQFLFKKDEHGKNKLSNLNLSSNKISF